MNQYSYSMHQHEYDLVIWHTKKLGRSHVMTFKVSPMPPINRNYLFLYINYSDVTWDPREVNNLECCGGVKKQNKKTPKHWNRNVMLMKFSSLEIYSYNFQNSHWRINIFKMTTFSFLWASDYQQPRYLCFSTNQGSNYRLWGHLMVNTSWTVNSLQHGRYIWYIQKLDTLGHIDH